MPKPLGTPLPCKPALHFLVPTKLNQIVNPFLEQQEQISLKKSTPNGEHGKQQNSRSSVTRHAILIVRKGSLQIFRDKSKS
jgi:hypothetical protein